MCPNHTQVAHVTKCYGAVNCVDCWPDHYVLEVYQIVLIVCAFCLVVIGLCGARAYFVTFYGRFAEVRVERDEKMHVYVCACMFCLATIARFWRQCAVQSPFRVAGAAKLATVREEHR